ncbi:MAG: PIN domain-containing protein [Treponema sp.]|nr:PIN domain-containing protein [Treponema sp.]
MQKFLLDSNILSEPAKPAPNQKVLELLSENRKQSFVSTLSYFEMLHGILILPDGKRKERLTAYLEETIVPFYDFLSFDFESAKVYAEMTAKLEAAGKARPIIDSQIASIALAKNLTLVTRNTKDFAPIQEFFPLRLENWFISE